MNSKQKKIVFTGGGSAGHVNPNIALIEKFGVGVNKPNWDVAYIGSKNGIEKDLIGAINYDPVPYYPISSGKLRRYFSFKNFLDPFKAVYGIFQSLVILHKLKPDVVFSKGGFVSLPVVIASKILRIPVIIHESDMTLGLTNKICFPMATKICLTFPETMKEIKDKKKVVVTGTPIRKDFFNGNRELGKKKCGFSEDKKIILVFGGSLGAEKINKVVRLLLPDILKDYQVVHICGKGKVKDDLNYPGYKQFEYLHEDFSHVLAASDIVISRCGANSVYELIVSRKPSILLPLGKSSSRGDQISNARYCAKQKFSQVIFDNQVNKDSLLEKIERVEKNSIDMIKAMEDFEILPTVEMIYDIVLDSIE